MKVFYHRSTTPNVGDDLNALLWQRLVPQLDALTTADWLIGIGTILDERINQLSGRKVVMGAGLRPSRVSPRFTGDVRVAAVRGELTAQMLDLPARTAVCDPGFLIASVYADGRPPRDPERVGFIPHVYSERWSHVARVAADAGFEVISPTLDVETFLRRLRRCGRVFTESLHGAIFADALRIPWARMHVCSRYYEGTHVADFKWRDAFSILGIDTTAVNRVGLISTGTRPWWSARAELRPMQAALERRLVRALWRRRDDERCYHLSPAERLQERCERLLRLAAQLSCSAAVERWPRAKPQKPLRVLAFPHRSENPYVESLFSHISQAGSTVEAFTFGRAWGEQYDVLHLQWPELHLRARSLPRLLAKHLRLALTCAVVRLRGGHVVWTLHNLQPHKRTHPLGEQWFRAWFSRLCSHAIALTPQGLEAARHAFPALNRKQCAVIPHGHYRDAYGPAPPRSEARERLQLPRNAFVYLFFGNIRPYKNVPTLLDAFAQLDASDACLVVAGQPSAGMSAEALQARTRDARIRYHLRFIPDAEVPVFLAAANAVVLPFDSIQNSGSVLLALSFHRAVLAPRLGALPEIQRQVGARWLTLYDGELNPSHLAAMRANAPPESARVDLSPFDWSEIARRTLDFYVRSRRAPLDPAAIADTPAAETLP
jgi:glycosyltransferase involved in cell wall biosynthesis